MLNCIATKPDTHKILFQLRTGGEVGMTEREQVIAELLYLKHDCLEGSATDQTLDKAIALLRAQEPQPPIIVNGRRFQIKKCPKCYMTIKADEKPNFCSNCGKAVKWDG